MGRIKDYLIWHENTYGREPTGPGLEHVQEYLNQRKPAESAVYPSLATADAPTRGSLIVTSPSIQLIMDLRLQRLSLEEVHWRQFEELVAELLRGDGYKVTLGQKSRDGGVDILAEKEVPKMGTVLSVWQAKKLEEGNKVGLRVVRELADTRSEFRASKGVIVTSTFLTRDAIKRIQRDRYLLEGFQKPELLEWIRHYGQKVNV